MKLVHKVEECAVYESNKHAYAPASDHPIKTYLLKISSSSTLQNTFAVLSSVTKSIKYVYNHTPNSIQFKAQNVFPLKLFIEDMHSDLNMQGKAYTLTLKLLADIGTQLQQIRAQHNLIIPFLSLEDIIVIQTHDGVQGQNHKFDNTNKNDEDKYEDSSNNKDDEFHFVFINGEKFIQQSIKPGVADAELVVDVPLKVNKHTSFLPAELSESALKRLPMRLTTTSWYYSLSALCIYALLQHKFKNGEDDIERIGRPFLHTSLYFCLKRCLKPDPEERVLLYV
jgi:hypothetical protein